MHLYTSQFTYCYSVNERCLVLFGDFVPTCKPQRSKVPNSYPTFSSPKVRVFSRSTTLRENGQIYRPWSSNNPFKNQITCFATGNPSRSRIYLKKKSKLQKISIELVIMYISKKYKLIRTHTLEWKGKQYASAKKHNPKKLMWINT